MKRIHLLLLLLPGAFLTLISIGSFWAYWNFNAMYLSQVIAYKKAEAKVSALQCLQSADIDFLVAMIKDNHASVGFNAESYLHFSKICLGMAFLIFIAVYHVNKQQVRAAIVN